VTATAPAVDLVEFKRYQLKAWASGDGAVIGATHPQISEGLCEAADLRAGERVLDVATGSGNTAIAAARRFCRVAGVDFVPGLLQRARERAAAEGFAIDFRQGDAEAIPYPNGTFDVVLSSFGSMFVPNQEEAALELLRVCRPGGRIGIVNWTPEGFAGRVLRTIIRHVPPAYGLASPAQWGMESRLRELFGDGVTYLTATRQTFILRYRSAEHWLYLLRTYDGPTLTAFASLDAAEQERLGAELLDLARSANTSTGTDLTIPAEYLLAVAVRT
jgi:ubiquinone/menaquinone biosynthesis C-methylase UbiE